MNEGYRHEYKYLISPDAARLLALRLPHVMHPDPHVGPDGRYTIRSLYFDDFRHSAFYDKLDGVDDRAKFRIRCYNGSTTAFHLERKEKKGSLTRKTIQPITPAQALALQQGTGEKFPGVLTEALWLLQKTQGLRPAVLVDYDRTPFVCGAGNTRITLDSGLRTRPYRPDLWASCQGMIPVLPEYVILEVKFDDFLPGYLSEVLSDIPKAPLAISKFALCMELL